MINRSDFRVYSLLLMLVIIWGLAWPINKIGLYYMSPIWFAASRLSIATIAIFFIVILMRKLRVPSRNDLPLIFIVGFLQMTMFMILINIGLLYVTAGRSAILVYTTPIWVIPLAVLFFNEKMTFYKWVGFFLGMLGVIILFSPWSFDWLNANALMGNGLLLLAALCWGLSILFARNMTWYHSPLELIPWQFLIGTIPVLIIALYEKSFSLIQWNESLVASLFYTGMIGTAFAYWASLVISKELSSITVSISFLGVPLSGLLFSYFLLHEPITLSIILAMILILLGIIFVVFNNKH